MLTPIGRNEKVKNSSMIGVSASATKRMRAPWPGACFRRWAGARSAAIFDAVGTDISPPMFGD
jgi:hypothetical protein